MDYIKTFLKQITAFSLHFSADCNMDCKYCYIDKSNKQHTEINKKIREAIKNGEFVEHLKKLYTNYPELKDQVEIYDLWGAEPTLNGDVFGILHQQMMDFFPNIHGLNFSTNSWCGGKFIYDKFVIPILDYAEKHKRHFSFEIQFSIDGPPELNDRTRKPGATARTLETIRDFLTLIPYSEYLTIIPYLKPTWDLDIFREYNNLEKIQEYYNWCDNITANILNWAKDRPNIDTDNLTFSPTTVTPLLGTTDDGKMYANWLKLLPQINTSHFKYYNTHALYYNGLVDIERIKSYAIHEYANIRNFTACSAGNNYWSLNYDGSFSVCHLVSGYHDSKFSDEQLLYKQYTVKDVSSEETLKMFYKNIASISDFQGRYKIFEAEVAALAAAQQINKKYIESIDDFYMLWYLCNLAYCYMQEAHITAHPNTIMFGRIRWWGNGAADALIEYAKYEHERGVKIL